MILNAVLRAAVERLGAVIEMMVDVPGPTVILGRVTLSGIAGTARLHTNQEVSDSCLPPSDSEATNVFYVISLFHKKGF